MIDKIVSRAPARVCLFGDHQDYLSLPIIATTIDRTIEVNAIRNNSRYFKIFKKYQTKPLLWFYYGQALRLAALCYDIQTAEKIQILKLNASF